MKIEFIKSYQLGTLKIKPGDQLKIHEGMVFESMNDEYYMLIMNGLRYDILKKDIKVMKE